MTNDNTLFNINNFDTSCIEMQFEINDISNRIFLNILEAMETQSKRIDSINSYITKQMAEEAKKGR